MEHAVPKRKGIVPDEAIETSFFPALNSGEKDCSVAKTSCLRSWYLQGFGQLFSVVQANIGDKNITAGTTL